VYQAFIENLEKILSGINPLILFIFVLVIGMYVFWKGCSETRKNNSSIFDTFFISTIFGIVLGRVSHIINNWSEFMSFIWYWLPYEKYGNEIFFFRVLPWRFLKVWDWGIDILNMFLGFLIMASIWTIFVKKWKWSHLFTTIFFTVQVMLGLAFLLLGGATRNNSWIIQGVIMVLIPLVMLFLKNSTKAIMMGKREGKVLLVLEVFFVLVSTLYISYTYLSADISDIEKGGIVLFSIWSILGLIFHIRDSKKDYVVIEKVSSVRVVSPVDINQPIKLPK